MTTVSPAFTFSGVGTSLGKKSVAATTSFSATLDSIAGVNNVAWSVTSTDETTDPADYTLVPSGTKGETVTFTSGAEGTAGILTCTVNSGVDPQTGSASTDMTASAKWYVATNGLEVGCVNETTQSDPTFGWTGMINAAIRLAGATSATTLAATATNTASTIMARSGSRTTGLSGITVSAGDAWVQVHTAHASAGGNTDTWNGQAAATGAFNGGDLDFIPGARGGPENWSGNFWIKLGPQDDVDTRSAYFGLYNSSSGSPFAKVYSNGGDTTIETSGALAFSLGTKPTITGSRGGNGALESLLTALAASGLIVNSTSA